MAPDQQLALMYYEKAAQQGHSGSQFNAGNHHRDGRGCHQSYEQAAEWFEKAARQGNPDAMTNLGFLYQNGQGVPQSSERATELWEKAGLERDRHGPAQGAQPTITQATTSRVETPVSMREPEPKPGAMFELAKALGPDQLFDSGFGMYIKIKNEVDASRSGDDPRSPWPALSIKQQPELDQAVAMLIEAAGKGHMRAQALCGDMYRFAG